MDQSRSDCFSSSLVIRLYIGEFSMTSISVVSALLLAASTLGQTLSQERVDAQNQMYQRLWNTDLVWRFDDLPTKGSVPEFRVPYSGDIYLDTRGGTINALRKYDQAFNEDDRASRHERWDTTAYRKTYYVTRRVGLFGSRRVAVTRTPHWHGHCNGWTAATIRHAEPQESVVRNGVTFTPADIKGLLAEIYIYQDIEKIGGEYGVVHPVELHLALTNWIGRQSHPIGMEADPGKEKWNYPIYSYASSHAKRGDRRVEVRTNVRYAQFSQREQQQSPRLAKQRYFHYALNLNEDGEIIGGYYYRDSSRIDLLWIPIAPVHGGEKGNERGNPYVDVNEVVALWRDSVPQDLVDRWVMIDETPETPAEDPAAIAAADELPEPTEIAANVDVDSPGAEEGGEGETLPETVNPE
jgi:hypothetical protein